MLWGALDCTWPLASWLTVIDVAILCGYFDLNAFKCRDAAYCLNLKNGGGFAEVDMVSVREFF